MWQLSMTNAGKEWTEVGRFETVTAAARRIRELEGYPNNGVFLEMHVDMSSVPTRRLSGFFTIPVAARFTAFGDA